MGFSRISLLLAAGMVIGSGVANAAPTCTFLQPIGGDGNSQVVTKKLSRAKLMPFVKTNWNTDFTVNQPYTTFKFFFTADTSDAKAKYPVEGFIKFSDGTSLQVINENMSPPIGTGRMFGPFAAVPGKQASQMNFKVGDSSNPAAIGFSYRISVQGCR